AGPLLAHEPRFATRRMHATALTGTVGDAHSHRGESRAQQPFGPPSPRHLAERPGSKRFDHLLGRAWRDVDSWILPRTPADIRRRVQLHIDRVHVLGRKDPDSPEQLQLVEAT